MSVKIEDRDNTLKIYAEDVFLASVEYSDSVDGIFRKAVLKDAEGKVIYDIDNARIADKDATFAIAARGAAIDVDDRNGCVSKTSWDISKNPVQNIRMRNT